MRRVIVLVSALMLIGALAGSADADIDNNPNHLAFGPGQCSNGDGFEVAISPSGPFVFAKEFTADGVFGVAKALYLTDAAGNDLVTVWQRPGAGLEQLTVRCWWPDGNSPTGWVGGDILFRGKDRR